jgi:hypothetical protein
MTTVVFNPDSDGTFPLSKIAFFHASLNKMNWISINLKKEISSFCFCYILFNSKQVMAVLDLIPKVKAVLKTPEEDPKKNNEYMEIPISKGDKQIIIFTQKKRFYIKICPSAQWLNK